MTPPHPLTNFEIQEYYKNEPRFNGVYSKDNIPNKTKDGTYVINLDEHYDIGSHLIALYVNDKTLIYYVSFGVEHISKEIKKFINNNKNIIAHIFTIQTYDSKICDFLCWIY